MQGNVCQSLRSVETMKVRKNWPRKFVVRACPCGSESAPIISVVIASSLADGKFATEREVFCDTSLSVTEINRSCHVAQHRKTFANVIAAPSHT